MSQEPRTLLSPRVYAAAAFVTFFSAVAAAAPYLPVFYQSLGLSLDGIGLLAATTALTAMVAAPAWGLLADRIRGSKLVLPAACLASATCAALLALAAEPTIVVLLAILLAMGLAGVGPLLDAMAIHTVGDDQHRYSRLRVWGSASFVVGSVIVGWLIGLTQIRVIFVVYVAAILLTALVASRLRSNSVGPGMPRLSGLATVLRSRVLVTFVAVVLIAWSASSAINAFLSIYLVEIGASASLVGIAWALGAGVEIPLMIVFPSLARRFGVERLVVAGAALLVLRAVAIAIVRDPTLVVLTMVLHGGGYALLLVGGVTYIARHAPRGAAATAQGVLAGVVFGLAQALGPGLAGIIAGPLGLPRMFIVAATAGIVALVALTLALGLSPVRRTAAGTWR